MRCPHLFGQGNSDNYEIELYGFRIVELPKPDLFSPPQGEEGEPLESSLLVSLCQGLEILL